MARTASLILALSIGTLCHAQYTATVKTSVEKVETSAWKKWATADCTMNYPSGWTSEGAGVSERAACFQAAGDGTDATRDKVELFVRPADGKTLAEIAPPTGNITVTASESLKDRSMLEYTTEHNGRPLKVKQETRVQNGRVWTLVYSADPARYDDGLYLADAMMASFTVR